jgi:hypothetical protein
MLSVYSAVKQVSSHYLNADSAASRTVSGDISFAVVSPRVRDVQVDAANAQRAVNCAVMSSYVAAAAKARAIDGEPTTYVYRVLNAKPSSGDFSTDQQYEDQSLSVMNLKAASYKNVPIVHICRRSCLAVVSMYSASSTAAAFVPTGAAASKKKSEIAQDWKNVSWRMVGQHQYHMQIQAAAGTRICFFNQGLNWDATAFAYKPKNPDIGNGDVIRIDEYA